MEGLRSSRAKARQRFWVVHGFSGRGEPDRTGIGPAISLDELVIIADVKGPAQAKLGRGTRPCTISHVAR